MIPMHEPIKRVYVEMVKQIVESEGGFVVSFPELSGCVTCGETVESAVANALDAKKTWLEAAMEDGIEIHAKLQEGYGDVKAGRVQDAATAFENTR